MDHNGAFAAEEAIDTVIRLGRHPSRAGEATMLLAEGGIPPRHTILRTQPRQDVEATPLLRQEEERSSDDDSDDHDLAPVKTARKGVSEWDHLPWHSRPSPYWLLFPFIFSAVAYGGIMVPKVNLILTLICREHFAEKHTSSHNFLHSMAYEAESPECRTPEVQARVSAFTLQGSLISGILAAIIAPKLGALSDRYGRKPIMCITNAGMLTGEILTILAAKYPRTFPVRWMLLGYFFDGLCGSFIASMSLSHSYATDCTAPDRRNVIFGYFHGALFTGIAIGPLIAGWIIKMTGNDIIMFYIALGCHVTFILFLLLVVPESLSKARQLAAREKWDLEHNLVKGGPQTWRQRLQEYNIFEPLKILYPTGPGSSPAVRRNLLLLASVDMIIFGIAMGGMGIIILYVNYRFAWGTFESSIFTSIANTSRVFVLMVVLPGLTWMFRGRSGGKGSKRIPSNGTDSFELNVMRAGILFDMAGFLGYTLAGQSWTFMLSGAIASVGGIGSPTLQAALTKHVPPDRVGQLLGAMGLLHACGRVVSPVVFNCIYIASVKTFPQAVFLVLTCLFAAAFIVSLFVRPGVKLEEEEEDEETEAEISRRESRIPANTNAAVGT